MSTHAASVLVAGTTRWASSARLALSLSRVGCNVSGVCPARGTPLLRVRALRKAYPYSALRPLQSLTAAIEDARPDVVIPCDDRAVQHLHELYFSMRQQGSRGRCVMDVIERSLGAPESHDIVASRYDLLELARQEGIRIAATHQIRTASDLRTRHSLDEFPCFMKADGTAGGRGVRIAHDLKSALRAFSDLTELFGTARVVKRLIVNRDPFWLRPWWRNLKPAVVAQKCIPGRPANCAVLVQEGRVLAGIAVEVVCTPGPTEPASVVRVIESPEMMSAAALIARRLNLSGFFGLDFVIEEKTFAPYLIEMNPRATPLCHLRLGEGRDMVGALWAELSGRPLPEAIPVTQNDTIAYFPEAWATNNGFLEFSYQDIPNEEPGLVWELLNPWPERTLFVRLFKLIHKLLTRDPVLSVAIVERDARQRQKAD